MKIENQLSPAWGLLNECYDYSPTRSQIYPQASIVNAAGDPADLQGVSYTLGRLKEEIIRTQNHLTVIFILLIM